MKITCKDIRAIPRGSVRCFPMTKREYRSAASLVSYVKDYGLPDGIGNYSLRYDSASKSCVITAIPDTVEEAAI